MRFIAALSLLLSNSTMWATCPTSRPRPVTWKRSARWSGRVGNESMVVSGEQQHADPNHPTQSLETEHRTLKTAGN